ncbi:MAG TPA: zf-HC2 domain-containing protein [Vicinamibacteria bacterium]|nr:zf-HC2 domain-containing protein [Vicinamibacteria bacterium]
MNAALACADGVPVLMDYLEGVLPAEERAAIDAHLSGCARCVAFVKSYAETPRILRAATAAAMPDEMRAALARFLAARKR